VVTLRADTPSAFAPQSDETEVKTEENNDEALKQPEGNQEPQKAKPEKPAEAKKAPKKEEKGAEAKKEEKGGKEEAKKPFKIDLEGIGDRVEALPIPAGGVGQLGAAKGFVYYVTTPIFGLSGPLPGEPFAIHVYDMKERKDAVVVAGAQGYSLSADGKKLLYAAPDRSYGIVDAAPPSAGPHHPGDEALNVSGMKAEIDPRAEWRQMFNEVYRQERDYFFEASMNGVDWAKERDKYAQLLPYVADRYDLTYILGEFVGELSNSHTYVGGGDYPDLHPINDGVLGVDFGVDSASGVYRFKKIYRGENWDPRLRSPLTEPGVNVKEGEYLLAVNGHPLRAPQSPYELFEDTVGDNVTLTVNSKPSDDGSRRVIVKPLGTEFPLRELDMIRTNREKVARSATSTFRTWARQA
jgi:tricorn protease